jgi:hypothetical protein
MKLALIVFMFFSATAFAWPSQNLSCSGEEGTWEGHPIFLKFDFQMQSPRKATGTMSAAEAADGPWTQGCTTEGTLTITPVNGLEEIAGPYTCQDGSGGEGVMMLDPTAMTLSTNQSGSTVTYNCQWQ